MLIHFIPTWPYSRWEHKKSERNAKSWFQFNVLHCIKLKGLRYGNGIPEASNFQLRKDYSEFIQMRDVSPRYIDGEGEEGGWERARQRQFCSLAVARHTYSSPHVLLSLLATLSAQEHSSLAHSRLPQISHSSLHFQLTKTQHISHYTALQTPTTSINHIYVLLFVPGIYEVYIGHAANIFLHSVLLLKLFPAHRFLSL
jgi:hypothetical protein